MNARIAALDDLPFLVSLDYHLTKTQIAEIAARGGYLIVEDGGAPKGLLRYNLFWDEIPFMNLIYFAEAERRKGYGRFLVSFWESEMRKKGYKTVMTSSMSDEQAQHFYRKLGYRDSGCLLLPDEALEIIFTKRFV